MLESSTIRMVTVSGSARERGRQYGAATADLIDKAIAYYESAFGEQTGLTWQQLQERATAWMPICEAEAPDVLAELLGVAEGAGRSLLDLLVLNLRGEIIYDQGFGTSQDAESERLNTDGCTSFTLGGNASGDGHIYAGQNWDWRAQVQETIVMVRIVQDPLPTVIMQLEAGQVGRHGVNSAGIALNANGLGGRFDDRIGLPQPFIRRLALNQSELDTALATLIHTPSHIASNALVTHSSGFAIDLEITPAGVDWLYPNDGVLVHGNHYQASIPPQLVGRYRPASADSLIRVPRVTAALRGLRSAGSQAESLGVIRASMSDHLGYPESVCTHADPTKPELKQWSTLLSSCVDLTTGDYFVTNGTPCNHPYEKTPWNAFDGPGSRTVPSMPTQPMEA